MGSIGPHQQFKVGLIQTNPRANAPAYNYEHSETQIRNAAAQGAKLAILPEVSLQAFAPDDANFISSCQTSHVYLEKYQSLAKELAINIIPGSIMLTPEPEDPDQVKYDLNDPTAAKPVILNNTYFIDDKGQILGEYSKANLWHPERLCITSATGHRQMQEQQQQQSQHSNKQTRNIYSQESLPHPHSVMDTPLGKVGMLICWDLGFPEAFRSLILQDAEIICIPTYWKATDMIPEGLAINPDCEDLFLKSAIVSRAFENTCAIVFCNAGGPREEGFLGISQVALPIVGTVKGSFTDNTPGLKVVDVDMSLVKLAERNYKVREDMRSEDWHYGYAK